MTKGLAIGSRPRARSPSRRWRASSPIGRSASSSPSILSAASRPTSRAISPSTESGLFIQDQWTISPRLSLSLGLRHDYFGTVTEEEGRLSSIVLGAGDTFQQQIAGASIGRVDQLYQPERLNFSPRIGLAWDPAGHGRMSIRSGFSLAYQPHHGQSISGARALPPDALDGVIQPANGIGTQILYDIPVPYNPEFGRGLNEFGGVQAGRRAADPHHRLRRSTRPSRPSTPRAGS